MSRRFAGIAFALLVAVAVGFWLSQGRSYTGDLSEILARGRIRVLVRPEPVAYLPHGADPVALERELAADLARSLGVELSLSVTRDYDRMAAPLLSGRVDLISASLTKTRKRVERVEFSLPYRYVDELAVVRKTDFLPDDPATLGGAVCARRESSYFETLTALRKKYPDLRIEEVPGNVSTEEIVDRVARGECYAAAVDSHLWAALSSYYDGLAAAFPLARGRPVALAMRPGSEGLRRKVNEFLVARALTGPQDAVHADGLKGIRRRKVLRMLTRNNALTYYIHRGEQVGFEYDLMRRFAREQGLRLQVVVPTGHDDLLAWLKQGKGDVVAAAMTIEPIRAQAAAFTRPYYIGDVAAVVREGDRRINKLKDLKGRTVAVRRSSSFYRLLERLRVKVPGIEPVFVPEHIETEELLAGVEEGRWDATLCDTVLLDMERAAGRRLKAAATFKNEGKWAWAVRPENETLRRALEDFIRRGYRGLEFNLIKQRYFAAKRETGEKRDRFRLDVSGNLSPYDKHIKRYADAYGLDWRLIAAQIYEESRFDPTKVSWAGAVGLMQVMPGTAREVGIPDVRKPQPNIHAGVRYLHRLLRGYGADIDLKDRLRFALAAYNAGAGHVADARRLAGALGLSENVWYGNVEKAMRLLSRSQYYKKARYGYCRGFEAVRYVRVVDERYAAYSAALP